MPLTSYSITCLKKRLIARGIYELVFTKPDEFAFKAGQFVLLKVPLVENPQDRETRAFSIASAPSEGNLLFVMKMKPGGRASRWIEEVLREGTEAQMQGPFGNFVLDAERPKEILQIATSTGVAPFRSQLLDILPRGESRRIDLVFGVLSEADLFWQSELEGLSKKFQNFFPHLALSNPSESWTGHKGWVQSLVPKIVKDFSMKQVFVCGNPAMTADVKNLALTEWGILKEDFHMEGYI